MDSDEILFKKNDKTIYWKKLSYSDREKVETLMKEWYCKNEPLCNMASQTAGEDEVAKYICSLAVTCVKQNYSVGAYDADHKDKLCGILVISHNPRAIAVHDYSSAIEGEKPTKASAVSQMLRYLDKVAEGLLDHVGTSDYLMVEMAAVDNGYLNMGLMSFLLKKVGSIAKDNNIRYITSLSSSHYAQHKNVKLGSKILNEVKFKDYVDKVTGEMLFLNPPPPHTTCQLMCNDLAPTQP